MSNVRLYGNDPSQSADGQPGQSPVNPQAMLTEAKETFSSGQPMSLAPAMGLRTITLRRTGARPFRFQGTELSNAVGWAEKLTIWHEINLFRTNTGKIVVDIRVFRKAPGERDVFRVSECDSIEEAIGILETYDPIQDILVDVPLDDTTVSVAELSLSGVVLRQRIEQTRRQYDALLGDLLHEIERQR